MTLNISQKVRAGSNRTWDETVNNIKQTTIIESKMAPHIFNLWVSRNSSIKSIVYYDIGVDNSGEEIHDKVDENMDFLLYIDTHDGRQFCKEVELQQSVLTHHAKKEDLYRLKKFTTKIHKIRHLIENHGYLIYHHWAYILLIKHTGLSHMLNNYRQKSGRHWNNRQPSIRITGKELYNDFIQNGLMQYLEFHPDQIEYNKSIYR